MDPTEVERMLSERVKMHARQLERAVPPAPPLAGLAERGKVGPAASDKGWRLGFALAGCAVIMAALAVRSWSNVAPAGVGGSPTVSSVASAHAEVTASTLPPTNSPPASSGTAGPSAKAPTVVSLALSVKTCAPAKWAPDGKHVAIIGCESNGTVDESYAYIFDLGGLLVVDRLSAIDLAWIDADSFITLASDNASTTASPQAYVGRLGAMDRQRVAGSYGHILEAGPGSVALWSGSGSDPYMIWSGGTLRRGVNGSPLAFSSDGNLAAIEAQSGVSVVRVDTGAVVRAWTEITIGAHDSARFSPDGRYIELETNRAVVLEISTGKTLTVLSKADPTGEAGTGAIRVEWMPDARLLVDDLAYGEVLMSVSVAGDAVPIAGVKRSLGWAMASDGTLAVPQDAGPDVGLYHEKTITIRSPQGQTADVSLPFAPWNMVWAPAGQRLLVTSESGAIALVHLGQ